MASWGLENDGHFTDVRNGYSHFGTIHELITLQLTLDRFDFDVFKFIVPCSPGGTS